MRRRNHSAGSLDMLIDTMCNTFGGVCFIALMVAIMSASLPRGDGVREDAEEITEQMVVDKEMARLTRTRDELKAALEVQKAFVEKNSRAENKALSLRDLLNGIASNEIAVARLNAEKLKLEDNLAKITTDVACSRREAQRLSRLLLELKEELGKPLNTKNRAVRTPVERELTGLKTVDIWLNQGHLYVLCDTTQVDCDSRQGTNGWEWDYSLRKGRGFFVGEDFFRSDDYLRIVSRVGDKMFVRIYSDSASFPALCMLRDDLIRRRKMYNWHISNSEVMHFVEGYDGRVQ